VALNFVVSCLHFKEATPWIVDREGVYTASVQEPITTTQIKSQRDWGLTFYDSHILPQALQCKQLVMWVIFFQNNKYMHVR
jgi:hypothetical protein